MSTERKTSIARSTRTFTERGSSEWKRELRSHLEGAGPSYIEYQPASGSIRLLDSIASPRAIAGKEISRRAWALSPSSRA